MIKSITAEQFLKLENFELKKANLQLNIQNIQHQISKLQNEYETICQQTDAYVDELNDVLEIDLRNFKLKEGVVIGEDGNPVNFPDVVTRESRRTTLNPPVRSNRPIA